MIIMTMSTTTTRFLTALMPWTWEMQESFPILWPPSCYPIFLFLITFASQSKISNKKGLPLKAKKLRWYVDVNGNHSWGLYIICLSQISTLNAALSLADQNCLQPTDVLDLFRSFEFLKILAIDICILFRESEEAEDCSFLVDWRKRNDESFSDHHCSGSGEFILWRSKN